MQGSRARRWLLAIVAVNVLAATVAVVSDARSGRDGVDVATLTLGPAELWDDRGQDALWKDWQQRSESTEALREWAGPAGSLLHEEISRHRGSLGGWYYYLSADPARKYGREFPGLVREAGLPDGNRADNAKLFCGNTGHSAPGAFDDCQIWGYWARHGQYVVYLEVIDSPLTEADFRAIARRFDLAVDHGVADIVPL